MVIVDTSVLVAALHIEDASHARGKIALEKVQKPFAVPEYIAVETATTLVRIAGKSIADVFVRSLLDNRDMQFVTSSPEQFAAAADAFLTSKGKLSFIDCALLALSATHEVITFDKALARAIMTSKKAKTIS